MRRWGGYGMVLLSGLALQRGAAAAVCLPASTVGQHGSVHNASQSYLGIDVRDIGDDQAAQLKLKDPRGAEIVKVDHDAPAGKMGLREHDVVLQMNGVLIEGEEQLRRMLHDCPPGKMVALTIGRDGQLLNVSAPMASRSEIERQVWEQHLNAANAGLPGPQAPANELPTGESVIASGQAPSPSLTSRYGKSFLGTLLTSPTYTGLMLEAMGPQLGQFFGVPSGGGLLVRSVTDNSPAAMAGLKAGDVVIRANALPVISLNHWTKTVREAKGKPISLIVVRDRQEKKVTLTPDVKRRSSLELPPEPNEAARAAGLMHI